MRWVDRFRLWWQIRTGQESVLLDRDMAAWLISLSLHVAALFLLTTLTLLLPPERRLVLSATPPAIESELVPEEFRFAEDTHDEMGALGHGAVEAARPQATIEADHSEVMIDIEPTRLVGEIQAIDFEEPIFLGPNVAENMVVKGEGSVGTEGAAGAIDRITNEILLSLEQRPTLVVWLFDQSGSMRQQRDEVVHRFDRVYQELGVIEAAGNPAFARHKDKPLLTAVASFGATVVPLLHQPSDDLQAIKAGVREINDSASPRENVFSAVRWAADTYRHFRFQAPRRNVIIVVFTDEAGDDVDQLDAAVDICRNHEMPVYVIGVPAPFGRKNAYVKYVDPDPNFDQRVQWLPVHQGPESLLAERLKLFFSGAGTKDELIDSGFGPFGLTRLTYETGGVYFMVHPNRRTDRRVGRNETAAMSAHLASFFDPQLMRAYRPEYVSAQEYHRLLTENVARAALVQAAQFSWTQPMQEPRRQFPKLNEAQFARDLSLAQRDAARLEPIINRLVETLRHGEPGRPQLLAPRWQAGFDLAIGRALAVKVRTEGYNAILAQAKMGLPFKDKKSDTWLLVPSDEIVTGSAIAKEAEQAKMYLTRVAVEHEGTPWAHLAARELDTPLGWQWTERFRNVAERRAEQNARPSNRPDPNGQSPPRKQLRPPPAL